MIIKFQKLVLMLYVSIEYFVLIFSCYLLSRTPFQKPFGSSEKPRSCPTLFSGDMLLFEGRACHFPSCQVFGRKKVLIGMILRLADFDLSCIGFCVCCCLGKEWRTLFFYVLASFMLFSITLPRTYKLTACSKRTKNKIQQFGVIYCNSD